MDSPIEIKLTRIDVPPRKPGRSRPSSPVSKYLSTAVSDQSSADYVHNVNKSLTIPERSRAKKQQRTRLLSASSDRASPESMASFRSLRLENTYKLEPDPEVQLRSSRVRKSVENLLNLKMAGVKYEPTEAAKITSELSDEILSDIKKLGFKRHKFVVYVAMGNVLGQGLHVASRALCDTNTDGHVTVNYQTKDLYALVVVHALYFE